MAEWSNVSEGRHPDTFDLTLIPNPNPDTKVRDIDVLKVDTVEVDLPKQLTFYKSTIKHRRPCSRVSVLAGDLTQSTFRALTFLPLM